MKSGHCPKCGSTRVYTKQEDGIVRVSPNLMLVGKKLFPGLYSRAIANRDFYLCLDCGYMETYIAVDSEVRNLVEEGWEKASS